MKVVGEPWPGSMCRPETISLLVLAPDSTTSEGPLYVYIQSVGVEEKR